MAIPSLSHVSLAAHLPEREQGLEQGKGTNDRDMLKREEKVGHGQGSLSSRRSGLLFALMMGISVGTLCPG